MHLFELRFSDHRFSDVGSGIVAVHQNTEGPLFIFRNFRRHPLWAGGSHPQGAAAMSRL